MIQPSMQKNNGLDYLFLMLLLLVSMWQVAFLQGTMKWDIMDITLPWNYHITESLANGELPFWNPFLNAGFAQMGINDTWNPITWLIGWLFGYDPMVIQFQYLAHLYLSGVGFYHLGKYLGWSRTSRLATASAYLLSGFMIGNAQHLGWTIGASWLPWVFLYFKKWEKNPSLMAAVSLAILTALMFLGSYPGVFVGLIYVLLFLFFIRVYEVWRRRDFIFLKKIIISAFVSGGIFAMLTLVATVSMFRFSEYINRGESLSIKAALAGALPKESVLTFLFPYSATVSFSFWKEDLTLVNNYIGLIPFVFLILALLSSRGGFSKKNISKNIRWYLLGAILFFGLAMGKDLPLRSWVHETIPLMSIFRLSSYFRLFGMFFLLIVSGFSLDYFFQKNRLESLLKYLLALAVFFLGTGIWAKNKAFTFNEVLESSSEKSDEFKEVVFYNHISTQSFLHFGLLVLLAGGFYFFRKNNLKKGLLLLVVSADLFFAAQLNMFATVVEDVSPHEVNAAFYQYSPQGYPLPPIDRPFEQLHRVANFDYVQIHVNLNHFHKIPSPDGSSPIAFKSMVEAMKEGVFQKTIKNPFLFGVGEIDANEQIKEGTIDSLSFKKINLKKFSPNEILVETNFENPMYLVFLQNYHPDWKVYIGGKETKLNRCNITFMNVAIGEGSQKVRFAFEPKVEKMAFWVSGLSWLVVGIFLVVWLFRKRIID